MPAETSTPSARILADGRALICPAGAPPPEIARDWERIPGQRGAEACYLAPRPGFVAYQALVPGVANYSLAGPDGFTAPALSAGRRAVYVSTTTGSDARTTEDAQDPATPVRTLDVARAHAAALDKVIRLRRGDVFERADSFRLMGMDNAPDRYAVLEDYGDPALPAPVLRMTSNKDALILVFQPTDQPQRNNYLLVRNLTVESALPAGQRGFGAKISGLGVDVCFDRVWFRNLDYGIGGGGVAAHLRGLRFSLIGCRFTDIWAPRAIHRQGFHCGGIDDILLSRTTFSRAALLGTDGRDGDIFSHAVYIASSCGAVVAWGNAFHDVSNSGAQIRSGGWGAYNLFDSVPFPSLIGPPGGTFYRSVATRMGAGTSPVKGGWGLESLQGERDVDPGPLDVTWHECVITDTRSVVNQAIRVGRGGTCRVVRCVSARGGELVVLGDPTRPGLRFEGNRRVRGLVEIDPGLVERYRAGEVPAIESVWREARDQADALEAVAWTPIDKDKQPVLPTPDPEPEPGPDVPPPPPPPLPPDEEPMTPTEKAAFDALAQRVALLQGMLEAQVQINTQAVADLNGRVTAVAAEIAGQGTKVEALDARADAIQASLVNLSAVAEAQASQLVRQAGSLAALAHARVVLSLEPAPTSQSLGALRATPVPRPPMPIDPLKPAVGGEPVTYLEPDAAPKAPSKAQAVARRIWEATVGKRHGFIRNEPPDGAAP